MVVGHENTDRDNAEPDLLEPDLIDVSDEEDARYFEERPVSTTPPEVLPPTPGRSSPPRSLQGSPTRPQTPALTHSPTTNAVVNGANPLPPPQAAAEEVPNQQVEDRKLDRICKNAKNYRILKRKEKIQTLRSIQKKSQAITAYLEAKTRALNAQFPPPQNNDNDEPF